MVPLGSDPPTSPEATAEWLRKHFRAQAARGLAAVIELELTGPGGGSIGLRIGEGRLETSLERPAAPALRLVVSGDDWRDLVAGRANAEMLTMAGRIQIDGDLGLALKMRSLFRRTA